MTDRELLEAAARAEGRLLGAWRPAQGSPLPPHKEGFGCPQGTWNPLTDDGGPAFPCYDTHALPGGGVRVEVSGGMSLRDYVAAKAMQALVSLARTDVAPAIAEAGGVSRMAYDIADAMLRAREGGTK